MGGDARWDRVRKRRRWQRKLDIVVYTTRYSRRLFQEFGIDADRVSVKILKKVKNKKNRFSLLEDLLIRPRIWERQIGQHDLYFQYLFPAHLVRKSPSIWFAAEPLRMLYDLRHLDDVESLKARFHVYPHMEYESASKSDLNVMLQIFEKLDRDSKIETLVTNSRMMEGYLEAVYKRKADLVAYPGINLPENPGGPVDNRTAIFVGRLWKHKRVDLVIEAISLLPDGNLIIVGNGAEKKRLKRLARSLGLKQRVRFAGSLDNDQLDRLFRSVTCGVYTPIREPFGIMPLEAASHGLPVVVTPDGGYTEVLDSSCAHVVPPEPKQIAEALDSLFSDHETARQMGAAARQKVEQYTWDHTANNLLKLFKKKMREQQRARRRRRFRPLIGAHYYPWYGADVESRHWNENTEYATVEDLPIEGIYSSDDDAVVTRHLSLAEEAGLDYLVINLQVSGSGLNPHELRAADLLFDMAAEISPDLSLCFMLTCDRADSESIESSLAYLKASFFHRPNHLSLRSKPVLWFFVTEAFIGHFFYRFSELFESTRSVHCIASSGFCFSKNLPAHFSEFFDGWSLYSPLQISESKKWEAVWNSSYRDFVETKGSNASKVFTICPGFDDTGLDHSQRLNSEFRTIPRDETGTYDRMQKACLDLRDPADLVVVTSFNEFHENTHIEPSEKTGRRFIEATRIFSDKLKSGGGRDPREAGASPDATIEGVG